MKQKRHVRPLAILVALAAVLWACSAPVEEGAEPGATNGDTEEVGDDQVRIVYWSMFSTGEPLQVMIEEATERFMDDNPNIVVEINWAGRDVLTQLQSAINAGEQVDIVDHSNDRVRNAVVVNDLALRLDDYLNEPAYGQSEGTWLESFEPGLVEAFAEDDGIYMVPREAYVSGFWYNVAMLEELGIDPQTTGMEWDEFLDILEQIDTGLEDVTPLGADGNIDFYNNWWFSYLGIRLAGLDAFRDAAFDETGESWREPEYLQAAEMVRDLQDRDYFQRGFEGSVFPAAQQQWVNGDIAMMLMGAWLPKEMEDQKPEDFEMDMFAFPNVAGGNGNDLVEYWANVYSVLESSENPEAAVEWVKYITSPDGGGGMLADAGFPVPLRDTEIPPTHEGQFEVLAEYETMGQRGGLNDENAEWVTGVLNLCNDQFFQLQLTPQEFIDCLANESAAFYN
jgi:raffinose/stachyose/melibiose transport system substrate-binding protein